MSLPSDFDWEAYIYLHDDLYNIIFTSEEAYYHYLGFGLPEKRIYKYNIPENFMWNEYYFLNGNIKESSEYKKIIEKYENNQLELNKKLEQYAKKHYTLYGFHEKRRYRFDVPTNFNWQTYISLNSDLVNMNEIDAKIHYISYGRFEKRRYVDYYPENRIFIICNINLGGTSKYINDLVTKLPGKYIYITSKENLSNILFNEKKDIIMIQQLIMTDILPDDLINVKKRFPNLKMVISIHDCYWLNEKVIHDFGIDPYNWHGKYMENNIKINDGIYKLFDAVDEVIHPSLFTFNLYAKYFDKGNFKLVYHNDFVNVDKEETEIFPIITKEKVINIGILHSFSVYKGKEIVEILMEKFKKYKRYKINFLISDYNIEKYNEENFNEIIVKYNIHCLMHLNKWGETYCYAMTKYLNSGLPILYNNIGAFRDRIPKKEKYQILMESENECIDFINNSTVQNIIYNKFTDFLDYIIYKNIDSEYKFPKTEFIVNKYYHNLINDKNKLFGANIVIITSKIYTSNSEFSYTKNRSIYSKDERFNQTIYTINSIKNRIPNPYIILFDNSLFTNNEYNTLNNMVESFINLTNYYNDENDDLDFYTNKFPFKAFAEMYQMIQIYKYFFEGRDMKRSGVKNIFKISGRYLVNDTFNYNDYDGIENSALNIFKRNMDVQHIKYYYTSFYKISVDFIDEFFQLLIKAFASKDRILTMNLEEIIPMIINYNFKEIDNLGITQNIAVWDQKNDV